ncbi:beta-ribofuranosylaminobenzene 5'-phosphate synthase family protein [Natronomonas sp. EA1]|uniref:beta-ribofuranosylaminobenzene 5'-phosphate synthase family protein n=1 Tax=Natronomonas sp. EA1 TaxID=3421655 RepID=UPI003EB7A79E
MARVSAGARLHFGFQNLSLAHERLYGGVGVALSEPRVTVTAEAHDELDCPDELVAEYASRACALLDVEGALVRVEETLPRHTGLGSGTQLALATLTAIADAHGVAVDVREHAPALGRGGRSGVGVAGFEAGGFVVDAGHPVEQFTTQTPAVGEWTVPPVVARHTLPGDWRFVLVVPDAPSGRSGNAEDESMRAVVERADPALGDELAGILSRRILPAVAEGDLAEFGAAVSAFGRLNGAWYADEQGGVYRPPAGELVNALSSSPAVVGVGQSSWGPAVFGVTDAARADAARAAGREALDRANVSGDVLVVSSAERGAVRAPDFK